MAADRRRSTTSPTTDYVPKVITETEGIGVVGQTTVYMRKRNDDDRHRAGGRVQRVHRDLDAVHAPRLPRPLRRRPSERFICPCHGGVYDFRGKVDGGPPVRPLDRFYTRVRNGRVEVGPRFSVNSELRRFSPRYPGEDLDGVGQYLYPSRPTQRKLAGHLGRHAEAQAPQAADPARAPAAAAAARAPSRKAGPLDNAKEAGITRRRLDRRAHVAVRRRAAG